MRRTEGDAQARRSARHRGRADGGHPQAPLAQAFHRGQGRFVPAADPSRRLFLWPGLCAVHAKFHPGQISAIRAEDPHALIYVHPECDPEVVRMADGAGSTTYLIKAVAEATAQAIERVAAAIRQPGGEQAVQLKVAEKAVDAYSQVAADAATTLIVPSNMTEVSALIGSAMKMVQTTQRAS